MPLVENIPKIDAERGFHIDPTAHPTIMIRILDPGAWFEKTKYHDSFMRVDRFYFLDTDDEETGIQEPDAVGISQMIKEAKEKNWNVIVHCHAGLCRSGAVTEVCKEIGFTPVEGRPRQPNITVLNRLRQCLGLAYDPNQSPFNDFNFND